MFVITGILYLFTVKLIHELQRLIHVSLKTQCRFFCEFFSRTVFLENIMMRRKEKLLLLQKRGSAATQKRKAAAALASTEAQDYNWAQLADTGKVRMMRSDALTQFISSSLLTFSDNDFQIAIHAFT
jgi:hypothetical protein